MSERLTTLACALGALALFLLLFVHREGGLDRRNDVPRPTTVEERGAGYRGVFTWLNSSGLRTLSLRERIDTFTTRSDIARTGNVLVVTLPGTDLFKTAETAPLQNWLHAGNTLLVLAALADTPDWAAAVGGVNVGDLKLLSGINFNQSAAREPSTAAAAAVSAARAHAYFSGVGRAAVDLRSADTGDGHHRLREHGWWPADPARRVHRRRVRHRRAEHLARHCRRVRDRVVARRREHPEATASTRAAG